MVSNNKFRDGNLVNGNLGGSAVGPGSRIEGNFVGGNYVVNNIQEKGSTQTRVKYDRPKVSAVDVKSTSIAAGAFSVATLISILDTYNKIHEFLNNLKIDSEGLVSTVGEFVQNEWVRILLSVILLVVSISLIVSVYRRKKITPLSNFGLILLSL